MYMLIDTPTIELILQTSVHKIMGIDIALGISLELTILCRHFPKDSTYDFTA